MTRLSGSSKLLRAINESAAFALLIDPGGLTRADLRQRTELSTPTISEVLRRLTDAGLVTVVGHENGRPGPRAEVYAADPASAYTAAISVRDVGATAAPAVTAALCDLTGAVLADLATGADFVRDDPVAVLSGVVAELLTRSGIPADRLRHVQIGVPGSYDARTGTIRHVEVPGLGRPGLAPDLADGLGITVAVDNDVNLAAIAERRRGAGRDVDGFALLWLGDEGLGLAIDIGGTLLRGARGGAGEIGYMPLFAPDSTHRKADLQTLVGGPAVLALAHDHGIPGRTPVDVMRAAAPGPFVDQLAGRIAVALAAVIAVLDPPLVVLAGQVAQAGGPVLLAAVERAMARLAPLDSTVAVTGIDDDAVLLGALDAGLTAVRDALIASIRNG